MATGNSSRGTRRSGRLSGGNRPRTHPSPRATPVRAAKHPPRRRLKPARPPLPDLHDILGDFAALSIVETAARSFEAAENDMEATTLGAEISTLHYGVDALQIVYNEIDLAILGVPT